MDQRKERATRILAVVAATFISLACGTNYAYSAWGPQFAERLKLSATQSNLIGAFGNVGMYGAGIPFGHLVDTRGPRPGVILGGLLLGGGYYPIKRAYDGGEGSASVILLCLFSFFTGCGSCSAFQAAIKTSAMNWPTHRGTATAFPLAAFGLSAFCFTALSGIAFPGDTSDFLLMLVIGTFFLTMIPLLFIRIPHTSDLYQSVTQSEDRPAIHRRDSNPLRTSSSWKRGTHRADGEQLGGESSTLGSEFPITDNQTDETSSLLSSASSGPGDVTSDEPAKSGDVGSHSADITGFALLHETDFYLIWLLVGSLTGIGLMTINNIGHDTQALWQKHDGSVSKSFVQQTQLFHVSVISIFSFFGRLLSGIGSDYLVKRLHTSRFWCLVASGIIFMVAQVAALNIENPRLLIVVSGTTGLAYGALFGVSPSIVADAFGVHVLAMNWGVTILGPVVFGNIFNLCYGRVFDGNSEKTSDGELKCSLGLACYRNAYWITLVASIIAVVVGLVGVRHDLRKRRVTAVGRRTEQDHQA